MKKIIILFSLVIAILLPNALLGQTKEDNWVNLSNYMEDKYERDWMVRYPTKPKSGKYNDLKYVTKIAFKKIMNGNNSELYLLPVVIDGDKARFSQQPIAITGNFEIYQSNGTSYEKINPNIIKGKNGWSIYELDGPAAILKVNPQGAEWKVGHFFNSINVAYDPTIDLMAMFEAQEKEDQPKIQQAKQTAFEKSIYTTPQNAGYTLERTDNLKDGTIVEHYKEGIRFIKKPNGDYASFKEPNDERDKETLTLTKGMDKEINTTEGGYNEQILGDYQITLDNGVAYKSEGINEEIIFPNGDKLVSVWSKPRNKTNFHLTKDKDIDIKRHIYNLYYGDFINSNTQLGGQVEKIIHNLTYVNDLDNLSFDYIENGVKTKNLKANKDFASDLQTQQLYKYGKDGLIPYGVTDNGLSVIQLPLEIQTKNGKRINFTNGDFVELYDGNSFQFNECHLTFPDGSLIEKFSDVNKFKVTHPNGDYFISAELPESNSEIHNFIQNWNKDEKYHYPKGTLTKANGKKIEYAYLDTTQEEVEANERKERAKNQQELNKLYSKYGKANVDNILKSNIIIGMPLQLIKDYIYVSEYHQTANYTWYHLNTHFEYKYIKVSNSTGKVTEISEVPPTTLTR